MVDSAAATAPVPPEHSLVLNQFERQAISDLIAGLPQFQIEKLNSNDLLEEIELSRARLPPRMLRQLIGFRRSSNPFGTLLFRNLPVDEQLPRTPNDGRPSPEKHTRVSEYCLLLLMSVLGEPIGYADEKDGLLIHDICPVAGKEDRQENTGSVFFEFHTENAFHPYRPDFVGLVCLRPDHDLMATTITSSAERAVGELSDEDISVLRQPLFRFAMPTSFSGDREQQLFSDPKPVLSGALPDLCFDVYGTVPTTDHAKRPLMALRDALHRTQVGCSLLAGDTIVVDNRVAVHGRTLFRPRHDGRDRWLQRLFVVHDFRQSLIMRSRHDHVCRPFNTLAAAQ